MNLGILGFLEVFRTRPSSRFQLSTVLYGDPRSLWLKYPVPVLAGIQYPLCVHFDWTEDRQHSITLDA